MSGDSGETRTLDGKQGESVAREPAGRLRPGMVLGDRYRIDGFLAQGGMGEVYSARDERLDEEIAIKLLRSDGVDSAGMKLLVDEVKLARRVTHANVCRVFDLGTDGPLTFLTMELLRGETLDFALRRQQRLPPGEVARLVMQIAQGVDAAHAAGVIHRDLKPSNVMLVAEGKRAVVTDFGIARFAAARTTTGGGLKGTPAYIAPEQLEGKKVTPAADVYALGVCAFELLTGELPFSGKDATELAMERLKTKPLVARKVNASVPESFSAAVERALERDPARRFGSAVEFAAALTAPPPGILGKLLGKFR